MFTGIIEAQGTVLNVERHNQLKPTDSPVQSSIAPAQATNSPIQGSTSPEESLKIVVQSSFEDVTLGESIAVNGVCLTCAEISHQGALLFFVSSETLKRTNFNQVTQNSVLNLERALTLNTRISGHLVQGHVDGQAELIQVQFDSASYSLTWLISRELSKYCVKKGSLCLNGVSLTINSLTDLDQNSTQIEVMIIPHTWKNTNISLLQPGDRVNVEVDLLAKHVERLCHPSIKL